jgi:putative ABC transport system permease protein
MTFTQWGPLERLGKDLGYSVRALRRSPGFTAVAVATLALGIGATTAIFSAIQAELLRPLPYGRPAALLSLSHPSPKMQAGEVVTPLFQAWNAESHSFAGLAAWNDEQFNLTRAGEPERVTAASVNADFLRTLEVAPFLGADFTPEQDHGMNTRYVLLGYDLWQRHFGGDPAAVGRQVALNDTAYTVVGVLPRAFRFPGGLRPELLVPGGYSDPPDWTAHALGLLRVVARPRGDVSEARMMQDLAAIEARHTRDFTPFVATLLKDGRPGFAPLAEELNGPARRPLMVLWGAVSVVLLLICANVAGLQLARASARSGELAVRAALGAGRGRLIRLIAGESVLVAAAGGALAILGALWLVDALRTLAALNLPAPSAIQVNGPVLAFAVAITLASGLLAGIVPAVTASRPNLAEAMKTGGRSLTRGGRGGLRSALVVGEIAMAMVLLLGAGLLLRSMQKLLTVPLGMRPEGVATLRLRLSNARFHENARRVAFVEELVARVRALPGVEHAAITNSIPLNGHNLGLIMRVEGQPALPPGESPATAVMTVTPDYFAAVGAPLLAGRAFGDVEPAPAAIVNRSFATRYFAGQDPVGKRLQLGNLGDVAPWMTIVGVVADTRQSGPRQRPEPEVFRPYSQEPTTGVGLIVRTAGRPEGLIAGLRAQVRQLDPELPLFDVATMEDRVAHATASQRLELGLVGFFAAVALALAGIGVYGAIAYAVGQSTQEIGLRLALGAPPAAVQRTVVGRGMRMGAAGVALGLAGGYALTDYLRTLLFETREHDLATFAGAAAVLLGIALLASYLPARRAARVDPVVVLRG